jgi:hypothetical protein
LLDTVGCDEFALPCSLRWNRSILDDNFEPRLVICGLTVVILSATIREISGDNGSLFDRCPDLIQSVCHVFVFAQNVVATG